MVQKERPCPDAVQTASAATGCGADVDFRDELLDQTPDSALVESDQEPRPDEAPNDHHGPRDKNVLMDREAGGCFTSDNVARAGVRVPREELRGSPPREPQRRRHDLASAAIWLRTAALGAGPARTI